MPKLSIFTKIFTLLIIAIFIALFICFMPNFITYITPYLPFDGMVTRVGSYIYGAVLGLPCIAILFISLKISDAVRTDEVFSVATSKIYLVLSIIMLSDCILLLFGVIGLFVIGEFTVSSVLALVDLVGIALSVLLGVLSVYISRAAALKEEADATL